MTEMLSLNTEPTQESTTQPAVPEKDEHGYYTLTAQLPIGPDGDGNYTGLLATQIRLNEIPDSVDLNDPSTIRLTLNAANDEQAAFPVRGFVIRLTVGSIDIAPHGMVINMFADQAGGLSALHMDHVTFAQLQTLRDPQSFLSARPGATFYLSVDLNPRGFEKPEEPAPEDVNNEQAPDESVIANEIIPGDIVQESESDPEVPSSIDSDDVPIHEG